VTICSWTHRSTPTGGRSAPRPHRQSSLGRNPRRLNPAAVGYLYFVAIDERNHRFSTTLADHNAAVAKYRVVRTR